MQVSGNCHCGNITFEAEIDAEKISICHCLDCQGMSGAPYNAVVQVLKSEFNLKTGTLKKYVKIAENGNRRAQMFCPECGTRIYATADDEALSGTQKLYGIRIGTLKENSQLRPKRQIWTRSAMPWVNELGDIPAIEMQPEGHSADHVGPPSS